MPKEFDKCLRSHGKVVTIKPREDVYIPICYDKKGSHAGEVHHLKKKGKK